MPLTIPSIRTTPAPPPVPARASPLSGQADRLEAAFFEQMLQYMGPQAREGTGSGGQGEAQFQSFLNQEYARILAARVDLGITRG